MTVRDDGQIKITDVTDGSAYMTMQFLDDGAFNNFEFGGFSMGNIFCLIGRTIIDEYNIEMRNTFSQLINECGDGFFLIIGRNNNGIFFDVCNVKVIMIFCRVHQLFPGIRL